MDQCTEETNRIEAVSCLTLYENGQFTIQIGTRTIQKILNFGPKSQNANNFGETQENPLVKQSLFKKLLRYLNVAH